MKLALCSDLHLEFADLELKNEEDAEVLILSGDILIAENFHNYRKAVDRDPHNLMENEKVHKKAVDYLNFLKRVSDEFPHVVYIAGNHEFYHGKWHGSIQTLRDETALFPNIHYLENDVWRHNEFTFVGGTLWTDLNGMDAMTENHLHYGMNDYRQITNDGEGQSHPYSSSTYRKLVPMDTYNRHKKTLKYIDFVTGNDGTRIQDFSTSKYVVVGHHCPSKKSTKPGYEHDHLMNGGYSSNLEQFIIDRPQIKVWTHGHTHEPFDYMIGETRILCQPRGYKGYESIADTFKLKYFEV